MDRTLDKKNIKPIVSFLIPTYNVEKYITKCLNSILNQTDTNFDILVCDDCSTDKTYQILQDFKKQHPHKIKLFRNSKNMKVGYTRQFLIDNCTSEYFYFVDADDYIKKNTLQNFINLIRKTNKKYDIVQTKAFIFSNSFPLFKISWFLNSSYNKKTTSQNYILKNIQYSWGCFINTNFFNSTNLRFSNYSGMSEDCVMTYIYYKANSFYGLNKHLYFYRRWSGQTTRILDFQPKSAIESMINFEGLLTLFEQDARKSKDQDYNFFIYTFCIVELNFINVLLKAKTKEEKLITTKIKFEFLYVLFKKHQINMSILIKQYRRLKVWWKNFAQLNVKNSYRKEIKQLKKITNN